MKNIKNSQQPLIATYLPDKSDSLVLLLPPSQIKLSNEGGRRVLPNFIIYSSMFPRGSFYKSAINAMIYQETNEEQIIQLFCQFVKLQGNGQKDVRDFKDRWRLDVLEEYRKESFFYKLLNNMLRYCQLITQIFYVQSFVKHLSKHIKQTHKTYPQQKKNFTCYRGAQLSPKQQNQFLQSKDGLIQSLGFMSTSVDRYIALNFAINTVIEIEVIEEERHQKYDYGYVFMENQEEGEVLFNVLASFQVVDVGYKDEMGREFLWIKLKYGKAAVLHHKYRKDYTKIPVHDLKIAPILISQQIGTSTNQKLSIYQNMSNPSHCQLYLQTAYRAHCTLLSTSPNPNPITTFTKLQSLCQLFSIYAITNQLQKIPKLRQLLQSEPIEIPELTDKKLLSQYQLYHKECFRCHPIAKYLLHVVVLAGSYFFGGEFGKCGDAVDNAGFYFRCVEIARKHEVDAVKRISNIYHTYYTIYCALKIFSLYLTNKKSQMLALTSQFKKTALAQYSKPIIFIMKIQQLQQKIFPQLPKDSFNLPNLPNDHIYLEQKHLEDVFQFGGLIGFFGRESTRVFYRLMDIDGEVQGMGDMVGVGNGGRAYQVGLGVLGMCEIAKNRLEYYYALLKVVPALVDCVEDVQDKHTILTHYRNKIESEPKQQWSNPIKKTILQNLVKIQQSLPHHDEHDGRHDVVRNKHDKYDKPDEHGNHNSDVEQNNDDKDDNENDHKYENNHEHDNNHNDTENNDVDNTHKSPSQIVQTHLTKILQKFPILHSSQTVNHSLYKLIFKEIEAGEYESAWDILKNGIEEQILVYPDRVGGDNGDGDGDRDREKGDVVDWRIRRILHCFNLEVVGVVLELGGRDDEAAKVYDKIQQICNEFQTRSNNFP